MKNRIIIVHSPDILDFYLVNRCGRYFLFTQRFSKGVWEYFRDGRAEAEIRSFRDWRRNPRLNKTIEKLPRYIKYAMTELVMPDLEAMEARKSPVQLHQRETELSSGWEMAA